jgi:hypothetical protein
VASWKNGAIKAAAAAEAEDKALPTRIILTVLDNKMRPYMGVFDSGETFYPRTYENGALKEDEYDFLLCLAGESKKAWLPVDSHRDPIDCVPLWLWEVVWAQLEAGPGCYYKFPHDAASLQGV